MIEVVEIDASSGAVVHRDFTSDEIEQRKSDQEAQAASDAAKTHRDALVAHARQKIAEASGLTADEMAALGF